MIAHVVVNSVHTNSTSIQCVVQRRLSTIKVSQNLISTSNTTLLRTELTRPNHLYCNVQLRKYAYRPSTFKRNAPKDDSSMSNLPDYLSSPKLLASHKLILYGLPKGATRERIQAMLNKFKIEGLQRMFHSSLIKKPFTILSFQNRMYKDKAEIALRSIGTRLSLHDFLSLGTDDESSLSNSGNAPQAERRLFSVQDYHKYIAERKMNAILFSAAPAHPTKIPMVDMVAPWRKIPYEQQLNRKLQEANQTMQEVKNMLLQDERKPTWISSPGLSKELFTIHEVIESPMREKYRNQTLFSIGIDENYRTCIGFQRTLAHIDYSNEIPLAMDKTKDIRGFFQEFIENYSLPQSGSAEGYVLPPYVNLSQTGVWRALEVRTLPHSGKGYAILHINTTDLSSEDVKNIKKSLSEAWVSSKEHQKGLLECIMIQTTSGAMSAQQINAPYELIWGNVDEIYENIHGRKFYTHPSCYMYINMFIFETVLKDLISWLGQSITKKSVIDLCCGIGTIGISLASQYKTKLIGIDSNPTAIELSKKNSEINGIQDAEFVCGTLESTMDEVLSRHGDENFIAILDGPRTGVNSSVWKSLRNNANINTVVYLSSDKRAIINDIPPLLMASSPKISGDPFIPNRLMCYDLFPHTPYSLNVIILQREKKKKR